MTTTTHINSKGKKSLNMVSNPTLPDSDAQFRRVRKMIEDLHAEIMAEPLRMVLQLSTNEKTGLSVNVPISTCTPTALCMRYCYTLQGRTWMPSSLAVQMRNQRLFDYLATASDDVVRTVAYDIAAQCRKKKTKMLRWNGVGDLSVGACRVINMLLAIDPELTLWVISRRADMIVRLDDAANLRLQISLDPTTPVKVEATLRSLAHNYRKAAVRYAFTRTAESDVANGPINTTFNYHKSDDRAWFGVDPTACPASVPVDKGGIGHKGACASCQRCFAPREASF